MGCFNDAVKGPCAKEDIYFGEGLGQFRAITLRQATHHDEPPPRPDDAPLGHEPLEPGQTVLVHAGIRGRHLVATCEYLGVQPRSLAAGVGVDCLVFAVPEAFGAGRDGLRLVFLANPNSPSGTMVRPEDVLALAERLPCPLLVDEAYADFAEVHCLELVARCPKVLVARSMSKSYALAGLRLQFEPSKTAVTSFDQGFAYLGVTFYRDTYSYQHGGKRIEVRFLARIRDEMRHESTQPAISPLTDAQAGGAPSPLEESPLQPRAVTTPCRVRRHRSRGVATEMVPGSGI